MWRGRKGFLKRSKKKFEIGSEMGRRQEDKTRGGICNRRISGERKEKKR